MGEKTGPSLNPLEQFVILAKTAKGKKTLLITFFSEIN